MEEFEGGGGHSGEEMHFKANETGERQERASSRNVDNQLKNIRERKQRVTRFDGFDIIRANQQDLNDRQQAGEDADKIRKEKARLSELIGGLAKIDSTGAEELETKQRDEVLAYFEEKKAEWQKILDKNKDNPDPEARENWEIYTDLIEDIKDQLPEDQTREEKREAEVPAEQPTEIKTLKDLLKPIKEFGNLEPTLATEKLKEMKDNKKFQWEDIEAYYLALREDIKAVIEKAKDAHPELEPYLPALKAAVEYYDAQDEVRRNNIAFAVTINPGGKPDIRRADEPPPQNETGSQRFIIDPLDEKDRAVFGPYLQIARYEIHTENALEALGKVEKHQPIEQRKFNSISELLMLQTRYIEANKKPKAVNKYVNTMLNIREMIMALEPQTFDEKPKGDNQQS